MAAKGRGRGIAAFTFNIEALGISRASLPEATLGPKPLFPDVEYKPVPLSSGEDEEYMLGLKQEMRCTMKRLPFNVTKPEEKAGVERYREMYAQANGKGKRNEWTPEVKKEPKISSSKEKEELLDKLNDLEKKDEKSDEEKGEKAEENEDEDKEEAEAEEYDEEEVEEENDYIASYFEDGDDYGAGSDDNMDEATY
ncbi:DNA-directed RNA polymerase III subunit RPC7 isoform X2 [Scleropages formosus]|uniref:DNA-directed RNA polymerase III subunit RPC7 isoform X2 n=1 Tax=Scleropages formosus TaxID=113540 RepID=UPI000878F6D6|nr:DNA-directed RNA polymerase III subunit RPC7 isoform X2 [Scleropages formosus]